MNTIGRKGRLPGAIGARSGRDRTRARVTSVNVVAEVLGGHRPALWVFDLYGAQQGHAEHWQVCLAHQLRDCEYAIDAGDAVFARA